MKSRSHRDTGTHTWIFQFDSKRAKQPLPIPPPHTHTQPSMTNQLSAKAWIAVLEQAINDRERQGMREGRGHEGEYRRQGRVAALTARGEQWRGVVYNTIHPLFLGRWWCYLVVGGVMQWEFIFRALSGEQPCVHPVFHDLVDPIKILISYRVKQFLLCYQCSDWLPRPEKLYFKCRIQLPMMAQVLQG